MNVKKYRAETTREALEQIKMDLGEDAYVLETKHFPTDRFLGLRVKKQIEISATRSPVSNGNERKIFTQNGSVFPNSTISNLTGDTPARPETEKECSDRKHVVNSLKNRAASATQFENAFPYVPKKAPTELPVQPKEAVELSTEAPRAFSDKRDIGQQTRLAGNLRVFPEKDTFEPEIYSKSEPGLLRTELREVKFSINSYANRQNVPARNNGAEVDICSEVFDPPFAYSFIELTNLGVSPDFAHTLIAEVIPQYKKGLVPLSEIKRAGLQIALDKFINFGPDPLRAAEPAIVAVIGATGVGKTTTIAKLAARIVLEEQGRVELVTLDTYRIAAVDQLRTYADMIGAGCHVVRSVLELEATIGRLPAEATILIDTTGRNPLDLADQFELSDFLSRRKEIRKCLAVPATTHPSDAQAAVKKFGMYGADCLALTKLDETTRPGAMLELIAEGTLPLTYLCVGQRVPEDLEVATPESLGERLLDLNLTN